MHDAIASKMMFRPRWQYALVFLTLLSFALAASKVPSANFNHVQRLTNAPSPAPTSFCKCSCFTNSSIIALDGPSPSTSSSILSDENQNRTCADCNKQFCLSFNLSICEEATEDDVITTCFQRDSAKDQAVVFIFIFATAGLLAWGAIKPYVGQWLDNRRVRATYTPVNAGAAQ